VNLYQELDVNEIGECFVCLFFFFEIISSFELMFKCVFFLFL